MYFQCDLNSLRKIKKEFQQKITNTEEVKKAKIKESTNSIEEKYNLIKENYENKLKETVEEIHNYCKKIEDFSTFNRNDVSYILADLVSIFEGKKYVVSQMSYHPEKSSPAQVQDILVIIEEENLEKINATNHISERYLHHLLKYGKIVMLDPKFSLCKPEVLKFYKYETGTINHNINFKNYQYLKDFIDFIINYRLEYNKSEISEEELKVLKNQFMTINKENIEKLLEAKAEKDIEDYKAQVAERLEHNKKLLKRRINKTQNK